MDMHCVFCDVGNDFKNYSHEILDFSALYHRFLAKHLGFHSLPDIFFSIFVAPINQGIMLTTNSVDHVQNMWSLASAIPAGSHKTGRISLPLSCHLTCQFY
jgi:hypothetical protein